MSDAIETKYFRAANGTVGRVQIFAQGDEGENPRKDQDTFSGLFTWERDHITPDDLREVPDALDSAVDKWTDRTSIRAYPLVRYVRTLDSVLYIGALSRNTHDGTLSLDDQPEAGASYDGLAVVTREDYARAFGPGNPDRGQAREIAHAEVKIYSAWASGEVFGYVAETADGTETDSVWGYIGTDEFDYMFSQGAASIGDGTEEISEADYDDATESENQAD